MRLPRRPTDPLSLTLPPGDWEQLTLDLLRAASGAGLLLPEPVAQDLRQRLAEWARVLDEAAIHQQERAEEPPVPLWRLFGRDER